MPPGRSRVVLGDSWVVEGDEEGSEYSPSQGKEPEVVAPASPVRPVRQSSRKGTKSPEPELLMPALDFNTMDGSWADTSSRSPRPQRSPRKRSSETPERQQDPRRRSSRQAAMNVTPEKRLEERYLPRPHRPVEDSGPELLEIVTDHAVTMLTFSMEIFGKALHILKTPISFLLAFWLLMGILVIARNLITNSIYSSLSPICRLPGSSLLQLPFCPSGGYDPGSGPAPSVEFDQLMTVQGKFEEVLEESAGGVSLPMDMKRGEASIRDLRQLVKYSNLHSKNELVLEFDGFIENARIASYDLQKFNSHIGRAVDNVLATTRWTTRVLDGIQIRDTSQGVISTFFASTILAPFQPIKFTESLLLDQYIKHTQIVEEEIHKLIDEAQALLMVLNNLEDRLDVIHGIVTRDGHQAKAQKDEILSELWTMVGGNRGKLSKANRQLNLLQQVGLYRKSAYGHVSGTILKLQAIGAGLEDLRERVGAPELLRDRVNIPLSVHIENIQRGVERLEEGRQNARKAESETIRQTLERSQREGTLID